MNLLREEALVFSAVEDRPTELFPPLLMEAFHGRCIETLKAMVQAWPFVHLPLGDLIDMPHVGPLQAVLEALDALLAQKVQSRRCKLRVLDLHDTGQNFWSMWSGASTHGCSSSRMAQVAEHRSMTKQHLAPFKVFIDLCLKKSTLDNFLTYLLSEMSNVQRLFLSHIHLPAFEKQEQGHVQITSQFLRLLHYRDLHLESPSFLEGCLDQMLRCLMTTLDNLSITNFQLTESDWIHLSQCPNISQLKGLDLRGVRLTDFSPELLHVLLEKVADTLQEPDLSQCGIMDSQLEAILPALSSCSQLRSFSLCGNLLSMAVMEKMLQHTTQVDSGDLSFRGPGPVVLQRCKKEDSV
ncbi:PRAME family member 4-like [Balaenoptera ricei]|uniref:PRAME family member 4-like n=1 Tax=Balaenoptera ricei TaxID=2746895 RepID=UPI0028BE7398|nr:PRAME family member 4-like [Balaenoptera ricei]